ncbi:hypothetical protein CTAYLR_000883 [Chrysophaeum taylorii]|uniref:prolyl aminopeptidase n=1 Tax=Chrysophaeum taylorii TaxID=2483200 RepID=A0AAD7UHK9_9STRA|nr:hypothetical protein CTAYLR_000883 [Chrysophaeum taylorii]
MVWTAVIAAAMRCDALTQEANRPAVRQLHPLAEVVDSGYLSVGDGHNIYFEVRGCRKAPVALWLHGGPGAGCFPNHARFCDPKKWRVTLVDQRGCGKSVPRGELRANTTPHLVQDLEVLRRRVLGDEPWGCVIGGSWGSTLGLAYATEFPRALRAIVLRGVCTMRAREIRWLFAPSGGAAALAPTGWKRFASLAPDAVEEDDVLRAYYDMLRSDDARTRTRAAFSWQAWEFQANAIAELRPTVIRPNLDPPSEDDDLFLSPRNRRCGNNPSAAYLSGLEKETKDHYAVYPQPLLTCHYSIHKAFLDDDLLDNLDKIRHIPAIAVQGGADFICPPTTAIDLAAAWPELELRLVPGGGHSQYDPRIRHELLEATDKIALRIANDDDDDDDATEPLAR